MDEDGFYGSSNMTHTIDCNIHMCALYSIKKVLFNSFHDFNLILVCSSILTDSITNFYLKDFHKDIYYQCFIICKHWMFLSLGRNHSTSVLDTICCYNLLYSSIINKYIIFVRSYLNIKDKNCIKFILSLLVFFIKNRILIRKDGLDTVNKCKYNRQ